VSTGFLDRYGQCASSWGRPGPTWHRAASRGVQARQHRSGGDQQCQPRFADPHWLRSGAGAALAGVTNAVRSFSQAASELALLSRETGISSERLHVPWRGRGACFSGSSDGARGSHIGKEQRKRASAGRRRCSSNSAQPVELSTDDTVGETAVRLGKAFEGLKLCYDASVVLMPPGAGQIPSESQHLASLRVSLSVFHLRPPFFIALSKTAADASHSSAPMVIGVSETECFQLGRRPSPAMPSRVNNQINSPGLLASECRSKRGRPGLGLPSGPPDSEEFGMLFVLVLQHHKPGCVHAWPFLPDDRGG
jgi:hypothetical protein